MAAEFAIATFGLTKQFERYVAVREVDLQVETGAVYGLIGPNGAGKTTLIRMLAAAEDPTAGEIYLFGELLSLDNSKPSLKKQLGYLPDDFPVYNDLTVWDYLDYFARLYRLQGKQLRRRLSEVLELVDLTHKRDSVIATLSRGMKQRLSLARTIVHDPWLLLLDEPVSGLDPIARRQFRNIIQNLQAAGMTILISSHVLSDLAELCSAVGIMELGCLVESTTLNTLYQSLSRQWLIVSTLGDIGTLQQELQRHQAIADCEILPDRKRLRAEFSGSPEESVQLLQNLVAAGLPITEFRTEIDDLEAIFLNLDHKQAS